MKLFLIGYRGTGKTKVAEILARSWNCDWVDSDCEIERRAGKSIERIFEEDGETAFRDLETEVVRDLAAGPPCVVSLGGGAVMRTENREAIAAQGLACWLQATPATIAERLQRDTARRSQRPDLTPVGGMDEIELLLTQRSAVYQSCANFVVDTEGKSPQNVAEEILAAVKSEP